LPALQRGTEARRRFTAAGPEWPGAARVGEVPTAYRGLGLTDENVGDNGIVWLNVSCDGFYAMR
jgi:hypothetical protein